MCKFIKFFGLEYEKLKQQFHRKDEKVCLIKPVALTKLSRE